MNFTKFGSTGLTVSCMCIGTGTFGKQTDERESHRILDKAAETGINFIDTADIYPGGAGGLWCWQLRNHYRALAEGQAGSIYPRHQSRRPNGAGRVGPGNSRKHLMDAIDASLRRLDTEYVDLYQLHMDDPATPIDETVEALDSIVRSGKARYIGVSNFYAYRLAKALGRQDTLRLIRFVSVQPRYNLLFREIERELLPLAKEDGLAVISFNPLAGGLLSGRYKHSDKPDKGRFSAEVGQFGAMYQARYWHEREFATVEKIREVAEQERTPLATLSVAWILANPAITSVILGASHGRPTDRHAGCRGLRT